MGWFSKSNNTAAIPVEAATPRVGSLAAAPQQPLGDLPPPPPASQLIASPNQPTVEQFVKQQPLAMYTIDGLQNQAESTICRANANGGQTCLKLGYSAVDLFNEMQKFEYFCSLPSEVKATHFECRLIQ
ncbi:hypothetical protein BABINDRAFT_51133 [Babjeviella inositovora NRRL Y-12698]|uniref:Uncharacterized protein n=1 Tax=Babjeviella inositovora NRRL Y-12698 TaxID=984486 RepID=A0A1E3QN89_9ASCO|nr:uncharacterized protein BABINDRAFT_51133 [Babjeviella inositovora NRRL Y-12698]ODQ79176.1 hypothetical protein BABINDRAFT_51133 [Babjeviella inositovora NRRL Y-12698]